MPEVSLEDIQHANSVFGFDKQERGGGELTLDSFNRARQGFDVAPPPSESHSVIGELGRGVVPSYQSLAKKGLSISQNRPRDMPPILVAMMRLTASPAG